MEIRLPTTWDAEESLAFTRDLDRTKDISDLHIDFTSVQFCRPFGTLLVAEAYRQFLAYRRSRRIGTRVTFPRMPEGTDGAAGYLAYVGFYRYVGHAAGKAPGVARGGSNYVPIQIISRSDLAQDSGRAPIQEAIERRSDQLAGVIFRSVPEQIMVGYCLREVIRNVFEHAQVACCTVMAQRYADGRAEIAIIDTGIGIYGSLCGTHACSNVDEALQIALSPGASRVTGQQRGDQWDNSGFGLYILSTLGRQLGDFLIVSNSRYVEYSHRTEAGRRGDAPFNGTAVRLMVNLRETAEYFPNRLRQIVTEGEARSASTGKPRKASASSTILSSR